MSYTAAAVTLRPFHGWLHPHEGVTVDTAEVLAHLRALGAIGAVQESSPDLEEQAAIALLLDDVDRVQMMRDGKVAAGSPLSIFGPALVEALGVELEIAGQFFEGPNQGSETSGSDELAETDARYDSGIASGIGFEALAGLEDAVMPPDVIVCRVVESGLPLLAHDLGSSLTASTVDAWTIVVTDDSAVDVSEHGWLSPDLPAVHLTRVDDDRYIQVLSSWQDSIGQVLTRRPDRVATFDLTQGDHPAVAGLTNPHLSPDSDLLELLSREGFTHLDARRVAAVLQSPLDDGWSARVLAALGLPVLAADVHEGRARLPEPIRVENASMLQSVWQSVLRYYDAPPDEVARRTAYGKFYDKVQRNPWAVAAWLASESALAVVLVRAADSEGRGKVSRVALRSAATLSVIDIALGTLLAVRRFRQR